MERENTRSFDELVCDEWRFSLNAYIYREESLKRKILQMKGQRGCFVHLHRAF
jgi:hypothetical protein